MSYALLRFVRSGGLSASSPFTLYLLAIKPNNYCVVAHYSSRRRSDSKNLESAFKVVKSKVRVEGN